MFLCFFLYIFGAKLNNSKSSEQTNNKYFLIFFLSIFSIFFLDKNITTFGDNRKLLKHLQKTKKTTNIKRYKVVTEGRLFCKERKNIKHKLQRKLSLKMQILVQQKRNKIKIHKI